MNTDNKTATLHKYMNHITHGPYVKFQFSEIVLKYFITTLINYFP